MDEVLTMEEIKARYSPDWVMIAEPETDDIRGSFGARSSVAARIDEELLRKARELKLDQIAVRYLGEWPEDVVVVL